MGLFSRNNYYDESMSVLSSIDTPSVYEEKFDWSEGSTYQFIAENEMNYTNIMKAVGIEELACFESGVDFVIESGNGGFFSKIIAFLKNIWEKIKGIFRKFIAAFDSMTKSNKDFINKYKSYLVKPDVLKNFKYKGYKFTIKEPNIEKDEKFDPCEIAFTFINTGGALDLKGLKDLGVTNLTSYENLMDSLSKDTVKEIDEDTKKDFDKFKSSLDEDWEDIVTASIRAYAYTEFTGKNEKSMDAQELSEEIFEFYRDDSKEKTTLDSTDISISDIITELSTTDTIKKNVNKILESNKKGMDRLIKKFDSIQNKALKAFPGGKTTTDKQKNYLEICNYLAARFSRITTDYKNAFVVCQNAWLKAMDDRAKQDKAICVALVNRGTNVKTESYDYYTNEGGYLGNVKLI